MSEFIDEMENRPNPFEKEINEDLRPSYDPYFEAAQEDLFEFLAHGDNKHRRWLREAIRAWFNAEPRPPVEEE